MLDKKIVCVHIECDRSLATSLRLTGITGSKLIFHINYGKPLSEPYHNLHWYWEQQHSCTSMAWSCSLACHIWTFYLVF